MQGPRLIFYTAVRRAQIRKGVRKLAATRLIALHQNKGKSVAACLKSRTDYAQNPEKTAGGTLVSSYGCSPLTVDEEFLLSKRQYEQSTGRSQKSNVIAYQIRQSFKPGEITPEEANKVGYELAMRFTKGRHAFIVATHTDRQHIHNHILYNSTSMDGSRKFRDFWLSGLAVQRLSDVICLEHKLSVIETKPYCERQKRILYPPKESNRDRLCAVIDNILREKSLDFEAFLQKLEQEGYEVKRGKYTLSDAGGRLQRGRNSCCFGRQGRAPSAAKAGGFSQRGCVPAFDRPCRQAGERCRLPALGQEVQPQGNVQNTDLPAGE